MRLTVGVISRNGAPFLEKCLTSLPALRECVEEVEFILVDSASTDDTLPRMLAFAEGRTDVRVFTMEGTVNAAAARNVILRNAKPGAVFLVDGDIKVDHGFVECALAELRNNNCDAVFGRLPEILHDAKCRRIGYRPDRYKVKDRRFVKYIFGVILLGPTVVAAECFYDEMQRRSEDFELGIRIAEKFRILSLPMVMGAHYTVSYFDSDRLRRFYQEYYMLPMGRLIRRNIGRPWRIWNLAPFLSGSAVGLALQLALIASALSGSLWLAALIACMIFIDVGRFVYQKRPNEYLPIRVVSAWQIAAGLILSENTKLTYRVHCCYPTGREGVAGRR